MLEQSSQKKHFLGRNLGSLLKT